MLQAILSTRQHPEHQLLETRRRRVGHAPNGGIFERVGEGDYRKRGWIHGGGKDTPTTFWADRNDDQQPQENEKAYLDGTTSSAGAYSFSMAFNTDLTFYARNSVLKSFCPILTISI